MNVYFLLISRYISFPFRSEVFPSLDVFIITQRARFVKPSMLFFLAISKILASPAKHADLVVCATDGQGFFLGVHSLGLINIIDAIREPDTAVSAEVLNRVNGLACGLTLNAISSDLPASLIIDLFTILESHAIVFSELDNGANVNHVISLSGLFGFSFPYCDYSIAWIRESVY